jgi:hypothetical protein
MENFNCPTSTCRHCRFYSPRGRRGGQCGQLNVEVMGHWKACALAVPPFAPSWEGPDLTSVLQNYITPLQSPLLLRSKPEVVVSESRVTTSSSLSETSSLPASL